MLTGVGVHTSCLLSSAGQSNLCLAGDGMWISTNGAAYVQVGTPATAGVTSWNGRTGAVVPTSGDYSYQMLKPGATVTVVSTATAQ